MILPFFEIKLGTNLYLRQFSKSVTQRDMKWHIDLEDRYIYTISPTNWKVQLDNSMPMTIPALKNDENMLFIPKNIWHRGIVPDNDPEDLHLYILKS